MRTPRDADAGVDERADHPEPLHVRGAVGRLRGRGSLPFRQQLLAQVVLDRRDGDAALRRQF
ncbi:hypothetical protein QE406_001984 [Microbacterium testaceum]|nr:hypothetical protein [Microbacterium testaceum]